MTATKPDTDVLTLTRQFKASRERVFNAFTSFEAMAQWFGPPGHNVLGGSLDFRVGGSYHIRIKSSDNESVVGGTYREITPPQKIVFTWKWEDDEDWTNIESLVTLEFHSSGDDTELTLTQAGFPSTESRDRHTHGWTGTFAKMDTIFAS